MVSSETKKRKWDRQRVKRHLLAAVFPERCAYCGEVICVEQGVCDVCRNERSYQMPPLCTACGRSYVVCHCGHKESRYFDKIVAPMVYEGVVKQGILRLKNTGYPYITEELAQEMFYSVLNDYSDYQFDFAVPVPMTDGELKDKGYNHSELLARALCKRIGVPVVNGLRKLFETRPQKELTAVERRGNLVGAIDVKADCDVREKTILLVDDVMTTGSTLDECAKMLKIYGAKEVFAATAAVTWLEEDKEELLEGT